MGTRHLSEAARKFLRELVSIVLGVLIALGIGEVADHVRHRANAKRALKAVYADMIDNASAFELWPLATRCADRRLAELRRQLDEARRSGTLRDIGPIGKTGSRSFRTRTWESAVSNGDTLYLDAQLVADIADYHEILATFRSAAEEARMAWARLAVLEHAPGRIDDNTLSASRQTVAELTERLSVAAHVARLLLEQHRALGLPVEYLPFNGRPRTRRQAIDAIRNAAICQPLVVDGRVMEPR